MQLKRPAAAAAVAVLAAAGTAGAVNTTAKVVEEGPAAMVAPAFVVKTTKMGTTQVGVPGVNALGVEERAAGMTAAQTVEEIAEGEQMRVITGQKEGSVAGALDETFQHSRSAGEQFKVAGNFSNARPGVAAYETPSTPRQATVVAPGYGHGFGVYQAGHAGIVSLIKRAYRAVLAFIGISLDKVETVDIQAQQAKQAVADFDTQIQAKKVELANLTAKYDADVIGMRRQLKEAKEEQQKKSDALDEILAEMQEAQTKQQTEIYNARHAAALSLEGEKEGIDAQVTSLETGLKTAEQNLQQKKDDLNQWVAEQKSKLAKYRAKLGEVDRAVLDHHFNEMEAIFNKKADTKGLGTEADGAINKVLDRVGGENDVVAGSVDKQVENAERNAAKKKVDAKLAERMKALGLSHPAATTDKAADAAAPEKTAVDPAKDDSASNIGGGSEITPGKVVGGAAALLVGGFLVVKAVTFVLPILVIGGVAGGGYYVYKKATGQ